MNSPLTVWKNIIWILGIVICLVALIGGFVTAAFGNAGFYTEDNLASGEVPAEGSAQQSTGQLYVLGQTEDGGQEYLESVHYLVDSSLIGIRDYALVGTYQVWGSNPGNIPSSTIADPGIRYPVDGKDVSVSAAVAAVQPKVLYISLGMDSINETDELTFTSDYVSLINTIRTQSPNTKIVLCSVCSVTGGYAGTDGMTNLVAQDVNAWIESVARSTGAYYVDVAEAVCDSGGSLFNEFAGSNGKTLNSSGVSKVLEYIRTHMA